MFKGVSLGVSFNRILEQMAAHNYTEDRFQ